MPVPIMHLDAICCSWAIGNLLGHLQESCVAKLDWDWPYRDMVYQSVIGIAIEKSLGHFSKKAMALQFDPSILQFGTGLGLQEV